MGKNSWRTGVFVNSPATLFSGVDLPFSQHYVRKGTSGAELSSPCPRWRASLGRLLYRLILVRHMATLLSPLRGGWGWTVEAEGLAPSGSPDSRSGPTLCRPHNARIGPESGHSLARAFYGDRGIAPVVVGIRAGLARSDQLPLPSKSNSSFQLDK